ncbi:MAG TPA: hypothetical protein QF353_00035 [Gammaproteobacteria bacterium]|nr:hypothetical protein [Gammaproteobacteria bacterium]
MLVLFLLKELQWGWGLYSQRVFCGGFSENVIEQAFISKNKIRSYEMFWREPTKNMIVSKILLTPGFVKVWGQGLKGRGSVFEHPGWAVKWERKNMHELFVAEKYLRRKAEV